MDIKAIVHEQPGGGYRAEVPGLPGVSVGAATLEELRPALRQALAAWIAAVQAPAIEREGGQDVQVLTLELDLIEPCPLDHEPNATTIQALRDAEAGRGLTRYASFEDFTRAMLGE